MRRPAGLPVRGGGRAQPGWRGRGRVQPGPGQAQPGPGQGRGQARPGWSGRGWGAAARRAPAGVDISSSRPYNSLG
ncbi:MAG TPA: hypothetical protein DD727_07175 [Clostridiales bacterium]|nr:hypothetical protein [Clostridiales bacterium]